MVGQHPNEAVSGGPSDSEVVCGVSDADHRLVTEEQEQS
jgi:hypothetical protein